MAAEEIIDDLIVDEAPLAQKDDNSAVRDKELEELQKQKE
jgi:hypothetical protein